MPEQGFPSPGDSPMPPKEGATDPFEVRRDRVLIRIRNLQHLPSADRDEMLPLLDKLAGRVQDMRTNAELSEIEYMLSELEEGA